MQTQDKQFKKDVIWNAISSTTNGMINMIISFFVINFVGSDIGGIFGFGFSTLGQQVFILSYFGIRIFQVIDIAYKYDFNTYRKHRMLTFVLSLAFILCYVISYLKIGIYDTEKCLMLGLICLFKAIEGIFDVYECELQRKHKLYLACQFNFARVLISTIALLTCMYILGRAGTSGIVISLIVFIIVQVAFGCIFLLAKKEYFATEDNISQNIDNTGLKLKHLTIEVLPIFLATFLDFWIFSLPKYALDIFTDNHTVGIFTILFMPATLMYLFVNFFLRPYLSTLADYEKEKNVDGFNKVSRRMYLISFGIAIAGFVSVVTIGKPVLGLIDMFTAYRYSSVLEVSIPLLLLIILGGLIYTLVNVRYSILAIKNKQKPMLYCYIVCLILGILIAWQLVMRFQMYGAALSFISIMLILLGMLFMVK